MSFLVHSLSHSKTPVKSILNTYLLSIRPTGRISFVNNFNGTKMYWPSYTFSEPVMYKPDELPLGNKYKLQFTGYVLVSFKKRKMDLGMRLLKAIFYYCVIHESNYLFIWYIISFYGYSRTFTVMKRNKYSQKNTLE